MRSEFSNATRCQILDEISPAPVAAARSIRDVTALLPSMTPCPEIRAGIDQKIREVEALRKRREQQQGLGRPIVAAKMRDYQLVMVGNRMLRSANWRTFHDFLRLQAKKGLQKNTPEKSAITIRSYEGFAYSWWVIVVCGVIIVVAVLQFAALVAGVVATSLSNTDQMNPSLVGGAALIAIPCIIVGSYLVGKWIGTRCARNEFITAILVSAVGAFASKALDYIFLAPAEFKEMFGLEKSLSLFLSHLTGAFVFVLVGTVLGVWRARRSKMSGYLQYLLRILPKETSATIVDLAYEEARRVR